jgi:hypothetical protein
MRYIYIDKKNRTNVYKFRELEEKFRQDFNTYEEFSNWVEDNFEMKESYYQSPYERTRAKVYATGNKWAIENFNATH